MEWLLIAFASVVVIAAARLSRSHEWEQAARTEIAEVVDREVAKVGGRVSADEPLRAPYTGRECIYYRLEFCQDQADRRIDARVEEQCDFRIEDDTGFAEIRAEGASFKVALDYVEVERASRISARALELAHRHDWTLQELAQVTITEGVVAVGEIVDVVGAAVRVPAREATSQVRGYREAQDTVPVFSSPLVFGEDREAVWIETDPAAE